MTALAHRPRHAGAVALTLAFLSGCGGPTPHTADASRAQETLHAVLDAWKAGDTPEKLAQRTPPIRVTDVEWTQGFKLVGYQFGDEGRLVGFDMNYAVVLELKSPKGKAVKKKAVYTVTTHPELLVLRQEG